MSQDRKQKTEDRIQNLDPDLREFRISSVYLLFALCIFCISICGCGGYSNASLFPDNIKTVRIEMFDNQSFRRDVEFELTDALAKRIESSSPYKIVTSSDRADSVISGRIISIRESALSTERETGLILEKEVQVQTVVNWKNLNTGEILLNNVTVNSSATYSEFQRQDFLYASNLAANNLARKIVEQMENKW